MPLVKRVALNYIRARLNILALVSKDKAARKAFDLFCRPRRRLKKKPGMVFKKGSPLSFVLEGHTVRGHRWLPATAPLKRVLILHGFESGSANFERYIEAFLEKGYEVLAFDAPAHGLSGGKRITLPLYTQTLHIIHERYGPVQSYMAHSFGGLALACFLETVPAEDKTRVALIAPVTEIKTAVDHFFHLLALSGDIRQPFEALFEQKGGHPPAWFSVRRAMRHIQASVCWFHDRDDTTTPLSDVLPLQAERFPNLRFVITSGLGHRKIYRDQQVFEQLVDFL